MKRRDVIVGLGGLVGSAGFTLGTGAFSAAEVERTSSINVVDDSNGLIGLVPNDDIAGVRQDNGELTISLGGSDPGINVNSVYQFGAFVQGDDSEETWRERAGGRFLPVFYETDDGFHPQDNFRSAFSIVNQTNRTRKINVILVISDDEEAEWPEDTRPELYLQLHNSEGKTRKIEYHGDVDQATDLGPGEALGVSFVVDATDSVEGHSLSGSLRVNAGSASD